MIKTKQEYTENCLAIGLRNAMITIALMNQELGSQDDGGDDDND